MKSLSFRLPTKQVSQENVFVFFLIKKCMRINDQHYFLQLTKLYKTHVGLSLFLQLFFVFLKLCVILKGKNFLWDLRKHIKLNFWTNWRNVKNWRFNFINIISFQIITRTFGGGARAQAQGHFINLNSVGETDWRKTDQILTRDETDWTKTNQILTRDENLGIR